MAVIYTNFCSGENNVFSSKFLQFNIIVHLAFDDALTLLVERQDERPACKNERWGAGVAICLERGASTND